MRMEKNQVQREKIQRKEINRVLLHWKTDSYNNQVCSPDMHLVPLSIYFHSGSSHPEDVSRMLAGVVLFPSPSS